MKEILSAQSLPSAKSWNLEVRRKGEKEEQINITDLVPIATQVAQRHCTHYNSVEIEMILQRSYKMLTPEEIQN